MLDSDACVAVLEVTQSASKQDAVRLQKWISKRSVDSRRTSDAKQSTPWCQLSAQPLTRTSDSGEISR